MDGASEAKRDRYTDWQADRVGGEANQQARHARRRASVCTCRSLKAAASRGCCATRSTAGRAISASAALHAVTLAQARIRAADARRLLLDGHDPIAARHAARAAARVASARTMTFDECAEAYIEAHRAGWKNAVHAAQWSSTLKTYVSPVFGSLPAQAIDTALVMRVIEPLWATKPETAGRLRGRIELILDWARVRGYRTGEIRHGGRATSIIFFLRGIRSARSSITPPCPMPRWATS